QSMQVDVAVRQHHAFRIGARAAGVEEFAERVLVELHDVGMVRLGGREKTIVVLSRGPRRRRLGIKQYKRSDRLNLSSKRLHQARKLILEEKDLGFGIIQDVSQLVCSKTYVQRQKNCACFENAIVGFQQPVTIRAQERHPFAGLNSHVLQGSGQMGSAAGELSVCKPLLTTHDRGFAVVLLASVAQKSNWRKWNIHDGLGPTIPCCNGTRAFLSTPVCTLPLERP